MRDGDRVAVCHPEFLEDLQHWVETDRRTAKRLLELVRAILKDPFDGIGKPEPLKYLGADVWSRRTPSVTIVVRSPKETNLWNASMYQGAAYTTSPSHSRRAVCQPFKSAQQILKIF